MEENAKNTPFAISRILRKEVLGLSLTEDERRNLDDWIKKDKGNRRQYEQLENTKYLAHDLQLYRQTDTVGQLALLNTRIQRKAKIRQMYILWTRAVAVAVVCFSLIYWFITYRQDAGYRDLTYLAQHDISPGDNKATLILSTGEQLLLDGRQSGLVSKGNQLQYEDGALINKVSGSAYARLSTPRAGQYKITLPDGTKVWLNAASELNYPLTFDGATREVQLHGEAYFNVAHNHKVPFVVRTKQQEVKVLGTQFAVRAYDAEESTTLVNGKVDVGATKQAKRYTMLPGTQVVVGGGASHIRQVNVEEFVGWKKGRLIGAPISLQALIPDLERWYDIDFRYDQQKLRDEKAYVNIDRDQSLSSVLKALETTYEVNFRTKGREVQVIQK